MTQTSGLRLCLLALLAAKTALSQEDASAFSLSMTVAGTARYSGSAADGYSASGGAQVVLYPQLKLSPHWFAYAAVEGTAGHYWEYRAEADSDRLMSANLLQGYVGYKKEFKSATILIKLGQLSSAFGRYPINYDDSKSPFTEPPAIYVTNLPLRPDQIPCSAANVVWQNYDDPIHFRCGGSSLRRYGLTPVSIYNGLPGAEMQLAWKRLDGRVQLTNSSPANPQSFLSPSQSPQWTVGGGFSVRGGLHVGASAFSGPYWDQGVLSVPAFAGAAHDSATGLGLDVQWRGGPWSAEGELQRYRFGLPGFIESPAVQGGYVQAKRIVSPRVFVAVRTNFEMPGGITDLFGTHVQQIDAHQEKQEVVVGYRLKREQVIKLEGAWLQRNKWTFKAEEWPGERHLVIEAQFVTSVTALSKAFH